MDATVSTWALKFEKYDRDNPQAYELFKKFALELARAGWKRIGYISIIGRIRYETMLQTVGDPFKINQNYAPYLARKFISEHPQYKELFVFKRTWS